MVAGVPGLPPPPPPDGSPPVLKVKPTPTPSRDDPDGPVTEVVAGVGFLMAPFPAPPPNGGGAMVTGATGLMLAPVLPSGYSGCCEGVMDGVVATLVLLGGAAVLCGREATDGAEVTPDGAEVTPDGAEVTLDEAEVTPDGAEVTLDGAEVTLDGAEVTMDGAEVTPDNVEVTPDDAEVTPDDVEVTPDSVEVTPDDVEVTATVVPAETVAPVETTEPNAGDPGDKAPGKRCEAGLDDSELGGLVTFRCVYPSGLLALIVSPERMTS